MRSFKQCAVAILKWTAIGIVGGVSLGCGLMIAVKILIVVANLIGFGQ